MKIKLIYTVSFFLKGNFDITNRLFCLCKKCVVEINKYEKKYYSTSSKKNVVTQFEETDSYCTKKRNIQMVIKLL